jgi:ATP-dependent exoDNAse (exonuclease V) alpha subunit
VIERKGIENCCVLAYTNIAANNVGGSTFHKTFKISIEDYKGAISTKDLLKDKTLLIIDEISQVPSKMYKMLEEAKALGIQILIFGDLKQILPIGELGDGLNMIKILCENRLTMTKYKRGDAKLLEALNAVRDRTAIPFDECEKGSLHFCFTKAMRDRINAREISKVKTGYYTLVENDNLSRVFVGMPLRSNITKADGSLLNGERWRIDSIRDEIVSMSSLIRPDVRYEVSLSEIHKCFMPGYAMTIHSSQGLTINEDYSVHIEKGLLSVAMICGA